MDYANEIQERDTEREKELDQELRKSMNSRSVDVESRRTHERRMEIIDEIKKLDSFLEKA